MNEHIALTEAFYYILLSLYEPLHGYGIMQKAEECSGGRGRATVSGADRGAAAPNIYGRKGGKNELAL